MILLQSTSEVGKQINGYLLCSLDDSSLICLSCKEDFQKNVGNTAYTPKWKKARRNKYDAMHCKWNKVCIIKGNLTLGCEVFSTCYTNINPLPLDICGWVTIEEGKVNILWDSSENLQPVKDRVTFLLRDVMAKLDAK